jgi:transcriptional regulator with XRE-family HTH domain
LGEITASPSRVCAFVSDASFRRGHPHHLVAAPQAAAIFFRRMLSTPRRLPPNACLQPYHSHLRYAEIRVLTLGEEMGKPQRQPSTIDKHIAERIRDRRVRLGFTQQHLGELLGLTFQQVHKYERGISRISAGQLYWIARALNVPIEYFYEGFGKAERQPLTHKRRLLDVLRHFGEIKNERHQEALRQLTRTLAAR